MRIASAHVFRGQTMTENAVFQPSIAVGLPSKLGGSTTFRAFGNLDLTDHAGQAWFDDGHAGEFTQIDLTASQTLRLGPADVTAGLIQYTWANNSTFPFVPFPNTGEVFVQVAAEWAGLRPAITLHRDIDEVEGLYARADLSHDLLLSRDVRLQIAAWLGWSDDEHGRWLYRTATSGLADAGLEARLCFDLDPVTSLQVTAAGSTIVDDAYRQWFRPRIDADVVWFGVDLAWRF
jgi:hypothetical protein